MVNVNDDSTNYGVKVQDFVQKSSFRLENESFTAKMHFYALGERYWQGMESL